MARYLFLLDHPSIFLVMPLIKMAYRPIFWVNNSTSGHRFDFPVIIDFLIIALSFSSLHCLSGHRITRPYKRFHILVIPYTTLGMAWPSSQH